MKVTFTNKRTKRLAQLLLAIWLINILQPVTAYALTSGPSQPEAQSFQPVGISDMVDLTSGDFKYNIPLLDVDGYPINLNYQSGVGIDDEASWVGLGWNLNVGAINRQLRGIPDDFSGDKILTKQLTKKKITVGGRLTAKIEKLGNDKTFGASGSFTLGVFSDNYTGIGAEIGINAGISYSSPNDGYLTAGMGIGILSSTAGGVDVTPNLSLSISNSSKDKLINRAGMSSSLGYNSRSGLKTLSFNKNVGRVNMSNPASVSYNTEPITPKVGIAYKTEYNSFSIDAGFAALGAYAGIGGSGYQNVREVVNTGFMENPEYGFLYAENGKNVATAIHDFIREKENPVIPELPNLALPIATPDVFNYTNQLGSGQFRLYRGGTGAYFDNEVADKSKVETGGGDIGIGVYAHGGFTYYKQSTANVTRKWTKDNEYLKRGDFQDAPSSNLQHHNVFFRQTDEKNIEDAKMAGKLLEESPIMVTTAGISAAAAFTTASYFGSNVNNAIGENIIKDKRQVQRTAISYLTATEAAKAGLDKKIKTYDFNVYGAFDPETVSTIPTSVKDRTSEYRKAHHISEITVTNDGGQRMVYGLPAYNITQEETSFAVGNGGDGSNNKVPMSFTAGGEINHVKGVDHYFHQDIQPAYAYSYLLTGILSSDFVDKTGDGISEDDNGTGIKFNYSKLSTYKWRTPYGNLMSGNQHVPEATLNRGALADDEDDKASIIYGEKEIYYVQTIESKTQIAYFITKDRDDGLGVMNYMGEKQTAVKQKQLMEIRLYSKFDTNRTKPIKVVKFAYDNELCKGTPNSDAAGGGKLTLKRVWFEYGLTHKGAHHYYEFAYNNKVNGVDVGYGAMKTDRWGNYKVSDNPALMTNEEYPYADQNKVEADKVAGLWHLNKITLPSGGIIEVNYEADDYAYVQNKKAASMVPFEFEGGDISTASSISVTIDTPLPSGVDQTAWFKKTFLNGSDYIYTKSFINVSTANVPSDANHKFDFVPAYCKINTVSINGNKATLNLDMTNIAPNKNVNPIRLAAWQKLKNEYPKYAFPGYKNKAGDNGGNFKAAIQAIFSAAKNLSELKENFYRKAERKGYCSEITMGKSFARLGLTAKAKVGGGARVKMIKMKDDWATFTGSAVPEAIYGQEYQYLTTSDEGKTISSGVASYEPSIGNDENALKQPVSYSQKVRGGLDNYFELEAPFGESLYPAPSIVYSKVTIRDLGAGGTPSLPNESPKTGYVVNEFYTAKDFPVVVKVMPIQKYNPKKENKYSFVNTNSFEEMVLSQGYSIELNDMHGKPRAIRIFNTTNSEISSTVYHYKVNDPNAKELKLNNSVQIVKEDGTFGTGIIGRDIELFTDFREQETINKGFSVNPGFDLIPIFGFPVPIPHLAYNANNDYKLFRSACAVKVIQTNGLIDRVVKTENGSTIAVQNVAYDGVTGDALITKTQNEFNQDYYTVNLPAYWIYQKMGGAYKNLGMTFKGVTLNSYNEVNSAYWDLLTQGDELFNLGTGKRYWVADNRTSVPGQTINEPTKILIDSVGNIMTAVPSESSAFKLVRSGYRNLLSASAQNIVSLKFPMKAGKFALLSNQNLTDLNVINAAATVFDDEWPVDGSGQVTERLENTAHVFTFKQPFFHSTHGSYGARIYGDEATPYYYTSNSILSHRLSSARMWINLPAANSLSEYLGFVTTVTAPREDFYYMGYAGDNDIRIKVNGVDIENTDNEPRYWTVYPIHLNEGKNIIEVAGYNEPLSPNTDTNNPGSFGVEIYDNTLTQLLNVSSPASFNMIFTTANLLSYAESQNLQSFRTINGVKTWRFTYNTHYNPFVQGMKGNWRPYKQKVYQENRKYNQIFTAGKKGVDVAKSGFLNSFYSYWTKDTTGLIGTFDGKWVTSNVIKQYDKYGQELENKDALDRFSAAIFDFKGELPAAVASNAMNREIYVNSFEDRDRHSGVPDTSVVKELMNAGTSGNIFSLILPNTAHTGNFSLSLPTTGIKLATVKYASTVQQKSLPYLSRNNVSEFTLNKTEGLFPRGFEPNNNSAYVFNVWVKDNEPLNRDPNITLTQNGQNIPLTCKAVVEGWKLIEGTFYTTGSPKNLNLVIKADNLNTFIDDLRIHPKDGQLKSYAYDYTSFKLMAELDENGFATFYEYDNEGSLARVKKETERGIATIKENRSSYRKKSL